MVKSKKNNDFKKLTLKRGISLLTLVITIVVIIILAVAVILSLNNNGLISNASTASKGMTEKQEKELIQTAYAFVFMDSKKGKVESSKLQDELAKSANVEVSGDKKLRVKFTDTNNVYIVNNGKVTKVERKTGSIDVILADALKNPEVYKHPEQSSTNNDIALSENGEPVNMDLWTYDILGNEIALISNGPGSFNSNIIGGKFIGEVPKYIMVDEKNEFYLVTGMVDTFVGCESLIQSPEIPDSVVTMQSTFKGCTALIEAPKIPSSVIVMSSTFDGCTALVEAPEIPSSVTVMSSTFRECTSLTEAPKIPSSVTDMSFAFMGCTSLKKVPEIPSGVTRMYQIFYNCTNLQGTMVINANPTGYAGCFYNAAQNDVGLVITGESNMIDKLIATKESDDSKITNGNL